MENKIDRQAYRRTRQTNLAGFTGNVLNLTRDVPEYDFLKPEITALTSTLEQFIAAFAISRNRGIAEVARKNAAQKVLLATLDQFCDVLEQHTDNPTVLIGAGFPLKETARFSSSVAAPEIVRAVSTGRKGELRIQLSDARPNLVLTHAVEYSNDKGTTWNNGTYNSRSIFVVDGLPTSSDLWLRFKSIGRGSNKSEWSDTVEAGVL